MVQTGLAAEFWRNYLHIKFLLYRLSPDIHKKLRFLCPQPSLNRSGASARLTEPRLFSAMSVLIWKMAWMRRLRWYTWGYVMDKHKRHWGRQKPVSIDGIVQTGRQIGVPTNSSYRPNRQYQTPTLDNFNRHSGRTDGFYPSREAMPARQVDPSEASEAQLLDEPIVLDHIEERKRKLKFWQRHAKLKRRIKRTAMAFMVLILAGAGYFGYKLYHTQKKVLAGGGKSVSICSDNVDVNSVSQEGDSRINILLLGIGGPGHDGPDLTDTILLASIDPITNKVDLISIPRDLWVHIPGYGYQKINAAYADGKENSKSTTTAGQEQDGITELDNTLKPVLDGVQINYHVLLDFTAFQQMVDALGGVTINVTAEIGRAH